MKNIAKTLFPFALILAHTHTHAQTMPTFPQPSPAASVSQVFGITKVEIDYSSPGVKGRQIWDSLVPYDSVWRTGANAATTISFSTNVTIGNTIVKKGKYALFTIPSKKHWTIILNSNADQFGAFNYDKTLNVIRDTVTPEQVGTKERMTFLIDPLADNMARVTLWWDSLKVSFDVLADTKGMVKKSIDDYANGDWRTWANSANYYVDNGFDLQKAQDWAQLSINLKESSFNQYVMAKILKAEGHNKEALDHAIAARAIGEKNNDNYYNENKAKINALADELKMKNGK